jgi:hypothetical protein
MIRGLSDDPPSACPFTFGAENVPPIGIALYLKPHIKRLRAWQEASRVIA